MSRSSGFDDERGTWEKKAEENTEHIQCKNATDQVSVLEWQMNNGLEGNKQ